MIVTKVKTVFLVSLFGLMLVPVAAQADGGFCATSSPESILPCLSEAYSRQDLTAYSNLLADDYAYFFGENPNSWGREMDIAAAKRMFDPDSCRNLSCTFGPGYQVVPGETRGTWTIKNLDVTLSLDHIYGSPVHFQTAEKGAVVKVRLVDQPAVHYQIYYWWCPGPTE